MVLLEVEVDGTVEAAPGGVRHGWAVEDSVHCLSPMQVVEQSSATLAVCPCPRRH